MLSENWTHYQWSAGLILEALHYVQYSKLSFTNFSLVKHMSHNTQYIDLTAYENMDSCLS